MGSGHKDSSENYITDFEFPKLDWCKMAGGMKPSPAIEMFFQAAKSMGQALIDVCFKTGELKVANVTFGNNPYGAIHPAGNFRAIIRYYDDFDANIFNFTIFYIITK